EIVFAGQHTSPTALDIPERVITIGTCSKSYAMTGWRVGWAVAPPSIAPSLALVVGAQINNLPLFVQRAAEAALSGPQECVREMVAAYRRRRDLAMNLLRTYGLAGSEPQGAFYLLVPVAQAAGIADGADFDGVAFAEQLITERRIAVAPGVAFGSRAARYARVSLASHDDDLRAGITGMLTFAQAAGTTYASAGG